jgi:vacuolar protein sorting-associated protein 26
LRDIIPLPPRRVKLEVGIENALHIEFEYERATYEVNDVIIGKAYFGLVRVVLTHAEISLVRHETWYGRL